MDKKTLVGMSLIGAFSIFVYISALVMGVDYSELFGITIIQIIYILGLAAYGTVIIIKKFKETAEYEKVPVRVESDNVDRENEQIIIHEDEY